MSTPKWIQWARGKSRLRRRSVVLRVVSLSPFLLSIAPATETVRIAGRAMGTTWSVKFVPPADPIDAANLERNVAARLEQLEQVFSTYRPQSSISRFNATESSEWISVPAELATVVDASRRISELTGGAYDVTVQPLLRLWSIGGVTGDAVEPEPSAVDRVRPLVDWRKLDVRISPPALRRLVPGMRIDVASMAKGFAVDELSALLVLSGASNHLIAIGGDLRAAGIGPNGGGWPVAIERPAQPPSIAARVTLRNEALSTSGNYRNSRFVGDRRVGHIIDARTGQPVASALASVSVVHESCAQSSALATALFVLGPEAGVRLATEHRLAGLFLIQQPDGIEKRGTPAFMRLAE